MTKNQFEKFIERARKYGYAKDDDGSVLYYCEMFRRHPFSLEAPDGNCICSAETSDELRFLIDE